MKKIKELRKKNGHTLKDLADKVNYDPSNLSKIERGINQPSLTLLSKIASVYSKDLNYFVDDEEQWETDRGNAKIQEMNLDSPDLLKKVTLYIDGIKITKEEMEFILDITRNLRAIIHNKKIQQSQLDELPAE
ncbi:helix-turn-helix domain-containing protein [Metabacillus sp. 84]|uniref:helix-turn-helix domain-containing protein n=1 Tax=unclassified Metabacillus TaxID=2675274 RepID=UPI003CF0C381